MRAHRWLLALATAWTAAAMASGCGGTVTSSGPMDSGPADVVADLAVEAGPDAAPDATASPDAACAVDADIAALSVPDAALNDAGETTAGCYACIQSACDAELVVCNADCTCKTDALTFLACVASGGDPTTCGVPLLTGSSAGLPLAECVAGPAVGGSGPGCLQECGVSLPEAGGRPEGGGDGSSGDAASGDAAEQ